MNFRTALKSGTLPVDIYCTDEPNTLPKKKAQAFCKSYKCIASFYRISLSQVDNRRKDRAPKPNQNIRDTFCNDCGSALFWSRE